MALPSKFFLWFCCFAWLYFPISLGSQASSREAQIAASAALESEAQPWSLLQPLDERHRSGLLSPLFRVLYDGPDGAPRLQPDARALRYMKRLYMAYATKEGIPKSNRSPLYNTVRLFTPCAQHKQAPGDQATAQPQRPSAQKSPLHTTLLVPPSLLLYLNDTSAEAYHRRYSHHHKRRPSHVPDQKGGLSTYPTGEEAAEPVRASRHRRDQETVSSELKKPLVPASLNLSEYFRQFLFPQNECELHDFRLSFSQLKWDNWIVAPHKYNPRYCKGDCPRAAGHRYGSPVHTMVQNVIHEKLDPSVPHSSCVPAKYSPLSVLTIETDGSIAYKEYEDMIATQCTCR
ncbi:growth/differentiation factor 9 isoform X1 [Camelus ferus]|uniref:Growth/differentiation factor 9 n=1 Tax=Camelus ferus TaxID=419612 RepID=A0A8B8SSZ4_CAMFR|nr:growth/differentiation factor 9 isoform X1 [Camelus ferus]